MQSVNFLKLIPGGNPTVLVTAPQISADIRLEVAAKIMHPLHLQAEQVGFINLDNIPSRLDMMGGEFCLNATRCLAFAMACQNKFLPLAGQDDLFGLVSSSGCTAALQVRVKNGKKIYTEYTENPVEISLECFVNMKYRAGDFFIQKINTGAALVRLPGITHLLLSENIFPLSSNPVSDAARLRQKFNLEKEAACGVVWYRQKQVAVYHITPIIHVAATKTSVLESACGSASLALSMINYQAKAGRLFEITQPSGETLHVQFFLAEDVFGETFACSVEVGGEVRLCARGEAFI